MVTIGSATMCFWGFANWCRFCYQTNMSLTCFEVLVKIWRDYEIKVRDYLR